jgi:hypothetical protein
MYLSIHPLRRVLDPDPGPGLGLDALALLSAAAGTEPVASWTGHQPGSSTGAVLAIWAEQPAAAGAAACDGTLPGRVVVEVGQYVPVGWIRPGRHQAPAVLQLLRFDGPRGAVHRQADELADRRIAPVLTEVPGLAGGISGYDADGGRWLATFADSLDALLAARDWIFRTELLPGEDPALLTGPDQLQVLHLVQAGVPLAELPDADRPATAKEHVR